MSLDSRLRRDLLEIGEGFDPGAAISFPLVLRRGERRARTKRVGLVGGTLAAVVIALSAGTVIDAVRSAYRNYNESNDPARRVVTLTVPGPPQGLVAESGGLFTIVERRGGPVLTRVERRGGSTALARFDGRVVDLAAGEGDLWVIEKATRTRLLRIDPASGAIEKFAPVRSAHQVTVGGGSVWLATGRNVTRLDVSSLRRIATIPTGGSIAKLEAGAGAVWVEPSAGAVMRIEPQRNSVTQRYVRTNLEALGETSAWLSRPAAKVKDVIRVDAATYQGVAWGGIPKGSLLAATDKGAWVVSSKRPGTYSLGHLDEPGRIFATTIPLVGGGLSSLSVLGDTVFVLNRRDREVVAIDIGGLR